MNRVRYLLLIAVFGVIASSCNGSVNDKQLQENADLLNETISLQRTIESQERENELLKKELYNSRVNFESNKDAVKYLDENGKWNRTEMEKYNLCEDYGMLLMK